MPRKCQICSNSKLREIDEAILGNLTLREIASRFDVHYKSVANHRKNHLQVLIQRANQIAETAVVERITIYRDEVNYAPLDRCKWMQHRISNELDLLPVSPANVQGRVALMRELRNWFDMENRLSGRYHPDSFETERSIERSVSAIKAYLRRYPSADLDEVIIAFSEGRGIAPEVLRVRLKDR